MTFLVLVFDGQSHDVGQARDINVHEHTTEVSTLLTGSIEWPWKQNKKCIDSDRAQPRPAAAPSSNVGNV